MMTEKERLLTIKSHERQTKKIGEYLSQMNKQDRWVALHVTLPDILEQIDQLKLQRYV